MGESEAAGLGFNPIAKAETGIQPGEKQPVSPPVATESRARACGERLLVLQHSRTAAPCRDHKKGHLFPGALSDSIQSGQATEGASSAVMSITAGSSSGTSTKAFTLMFRWRSKPVPAGMMWPMMTFSLKPRR